MRVFKNARFLLIFFSVLISACSYPPLNKESGASFSDYTYLIGPGDIINIFVWDNPDISKEVVVRPDGNITAPLIKDILVSGKTPFQVARELEAVYKTYIRDPEVVVMVSGFQGVDAQQIRIVGQLGETGGGGSDDDSSNRYSGMAIPYVRGMTLLDVVIKIGSVGEFADGNRASIIRKINGAQQRYGVKLDDLIEDGDMSENVAMFPGDILIIPEAYF